MSDFERLQQGRLSSVERALLESAAQDAPDPERVKRAALALGLVPPVTIAPPLLGSLGAGKWALGAVLLAALGAGGLYLTRSAVPANEAALGAAPLAAPPAVPPAAGVPAVAPAAEAEVAAALEPEPAEKTATKPNRAASPALAEQVAHIDSIRSLLAHGSAPAALDEIARYRKLYPQGALRQEAFLLELEAWHASGQTARASRAASEFLRRYPTSPHAERVARFTQTP